MSSYLLYFKKLKLVFTSIEFQKYCSNFVISDYLALICFLLFVASDGKDRHGLKLEKVGCYACKNHQINYFG